MLILSNAFRDLIHSDNNYATLEEQKIQQRAFKTILQKRSLFLTIQFVEHGTWSETSTL
jgi:hypothetical protein